MSAQREVRLDVHGKYPAVLEAEAKREAEKFFGHTDITLDRSYTATPYLRNADGVQLWEATITVKETP